MYAQDIDAKLHAELQHQLSWIGKILSAPASLYVQKHAKGNPRVDLATDCAPAHWGIVAKDIKKKERKEEKDRGKRFATIMSNIGRINKPRKPND